MQLHNFFDGKQSVTGYQNRPGKERGGLKSLCVTLYFAPCYSVKFLNYCYTEIQRGDTEGHRMKLYMI